MDRFSGPSPSLLAGVTELHQISHRKSARTAAAHRAVTSRTAAAVKSEGDTKVAIVQNQSFFFAPVVLANLGLVLAPEMLMC